MNFSYPSRGWSIIISAASVLAGCSGDRPAPIAATEARAEEPRGAEAQPIAAAPDEPHSGRPPQRAAKEVWLKPTETRDTSLREKLSETDLAPHWIYDDLNAARDEAERSGKPLLVLFRCVPCQCAATLDEQVAQRNSASEALQKQFVCVRVVQLNGVNLDQFQFDRDLSFAVVFMNADGTVYGRYGTRATIDRKSMSHISHASFQKAMERALKIHQNYPGNKAQLAGRRGPAVAEKFAEEMKHMTPFGWPAEAKDCIHCHMAEEARLKQLQEDGKLTRSDLWVYPLPENVGLKLDTDDGLLVKSVVEHSPAAAAGLRQGDQLTSMNGQPLLSQGDVQWVLHHLPEEAELHVAFTRDGRSMEKTLALSGDWKKTDTTWRASTAGIRPGMRLRTNLFKHNQGIAPDEMALIVNYPRGPAADAGLREGDLIIEVDGRKDLLSESEFLAYIYFHEPRPREIRLKVVRKGERLETILSLARAE